MQGRHCPILPVVLTAFGIQLNGRKVKIKKHPSEYLKHIYYDSVTYAQESLELCVKVATPDHVLYGSDYPFNLGDMEGCLGRVNNLPEDVRHKVRGDNAERIFNL